MSVVCLLHFLFNIVRERSKLSLEALSDIVEKILVHRFTIDTGYSALGDSSPCEQHELADQQTGQVIERVSIFTMVPYRKLICGFHVLTDERGANPG
jgi:hypothetical protein